MSPRGRRALRFPGAERGGTRDALSPAPAVGGRGGEAEAASGRQGAHLLWVLLSKRATETTSHISAGQKKNPKNEKRLVRGLLGGEGLHGALDPPQASPAAGLEQNSAGFGGVLRSLSCLTALQCGSGPAEAALPPTHLILDAQKGKGEQIPGTATEAGCPRGSFFSFFFLNQVLSASSLSPREREGGLCLSFPQ